MEDDPNGRRLKKTLENLIFFVKKQKKLPYLLVMPKYWGKQIFTHGSFPEVGQKQKTERKRKRKKEKKRKTESG